MQIITNTPLTQVPEDYCPEGTGNWFTLPHGYDAGKTMFYYDHQTGSGEPEATVLFVHGNPECSYTWRHARDYLIASGRNIRIIAMDHIGFGLSDQADFEMVDMHHAENLKQLVRHLDLQNVTLVVHDWGGPIGVGALLEDATRVTALHVVNSTVFPMPEEGLTYTNFPYPYFPWVLTGYIIPWRLWGGVAAGVVRGLNRMGFVEFQKLALSNIWAFARRRLEPASAAYVFGEQFRTKANAVASKRHVRQTPYWGYGYSYKDKRHGMQDNRAFYEFIQTQITPRWGVSGQNITVRGTFGQWDACGKAEVIAQWTGALRQMLGYIKRYPDAGHFIEESHGAEIGEAILAQNGIGKPPRNPYTGSLPE